jgi:hypothetical protein
VLNLLLGVPGWLLELGGSWEAGLGQEVVPNTIAFTHQISARFAAPNPYSCQAVVPCASSLISARLVTPNLIGCLVQCLAVMPCSSGVQQSGWAGEGQVGMVSVGWLGTREW